MSTELQQKSATYAIDATHSNVEFVVRHLMISKVRGRFGTFQGTLQVPEGSDLPSAIDVSIVTASVDTRENQRDTHLRSADFFEVEKYPAMHFTGKRFEGTAENFTITGDLTIRDVTREVTLNAQFEGRNGDPWGGQRIAYSASTSINRKDFGLTWNNALETGGVMVGDEVKIELDIQAVLQQ
jgi:polyisoprenoid-binding protein YceI